MTIGNRKSMTPFSTMVVDDSAASAFCRGDRGDEGTSDVSDATVGDEESSVDTTFEALAFAEGVFFLPLLRFDKDDEDEDDECSLGGGGGDEVVSARALSSLFDEEKGDEKSNQLVFFLLRVVPDEAIVW